MADMEEITKTKTVKLDVILRIDICQILPVIDKVMNGIFFLAPVQKMCHFLGWVELGPIRVGDTRIRGEIANGKRHLVEGGEMG